MYNHDDATAAGANPAEPYDPYSLEPYPQPFTPER